jgi:subtilisin-like proprotein convertase family protein/uncharacterized protein YvpB
LTGGMKFALHYVVNDPHPSKSSMKKHTPDILLLLCSFLISLFSLSSIGHAESAKPTSQKSTISTVLNSPTHTINYLPQEIHDLSPTPGDQITDLVTPTPTSTATITSTPGVESTSTLTATSTMPGVDFSIVFGPVIANHLIIAPAEIDDYLICDSLASPINIPDNNAGGIEDKIIVSRSGLIDDIEIYLNIDHTWIGDLQISLDFEGTEYNAMLVDRPGIPESDQGCELDNIRTILDDQASQPAENKCLSYPAAIAGIYQPSSSLAIFRGTPASGTWSLKIRDNSAADSGQLNKWCLRFALSERLPPPTPILPPENLPESARLFEISGEDQALPLDCESRSAVDWAGYFGTHIDEFEFLYGLPNSDNPDLGFVGDVNGTWGQIPPDDYGVHAGPVADLLNDYGLNARAKMSLTWDAIRSEIANDRPVIAWVIGSVINGSPVYYTSQSRPGASIVARFEHTVMVIGYTPDSVIILDGDDIYTRSLNRFLESWSALNNMAVLVGDP